MMNAKKRRCSNVGEEGHTSYVKLKVELNECQHELGLVRQALQDSEILTAVLAGDCEQQQHKYRVTNGTG
jgi:hypothetical protein